MFWCLQQLVYGGFTGSTLVYVTVLQDIRYKDVRVLPTDASPALLRVNSAPAKLDYISFVLICLQMGMWC